MFKGLFDFLGMATFVGLVAVALSTGAFRLETEIDWNALGRLLLRQGSATVGNEVPSAGETAGFECSTDTGTCTPVEGSNE